MTFFERYKALCLERGIQPASQYAADQLGCSKSNISTFSKNGKIPSGDIVANAARMLNVTADYLLGITDEPRPLEAIKHLQPEEESMVKMLRQLNPPAVHAATAMVAGLVAEPSYNKNTKKEENED